MAYRNRKAYSKTARRGIPRAQDNIPSRWDRFKGWAGDKLQDFRDSTVNMENVFGTSPEERASRRQRDLMDSRAQYHNIRRVTGEGAPGIVDQGVIDYVKETGPGHPYNPHYAKLEQFESEQNPGIEDTYAGPMSPGQTGFDAFGHETGNIDTSDEAMIAQASQTKQPPFVKRGGILKRGGTVRTSNVLGKGGTPKAKRGGSVGRNGIL